MERTNKYQNAIYIIALAVAALITYYFWQTAEIKRAEESLNILPSINPLENIYRNPFNERL